MRLNCSRTIVGSIVLAALSLFAAPLLAQLHGDDWQTGTVVKQEALAPPNIKGKSWNCLWPAIIYSINSAPYEYQFLGWIYDLPSGPVRFKIYSDGNVRLREPKSSTLHQFTLFRKIAGSGYSPPVALPRKTKHRNWIAARIIASDPVLFAVPPLAGSGPPLPCAYIPLVWKYELEVTGRIYMFRWGNHLPLEVTIGGVSRLAFGKSGTAYLIDDNGRERKLQAVGIKQP